jgi:DNA adenine methylase
VRYAGGKKKLIATILGRFGDDIISAILRGEVRTYTEPFVGGGGSAIRILRVLPSNLKIELNDFDRNVADLWTCILREPDYLVKRIREHHLSVDSYKSAIDALEGEALDSRERGFLTLFTQQGSRNGSILKGPIGGWCQRNKNPRSQITSEWRPECLVSSVWQMHALLRKFRSCDISSTDFAPLVRCAGPDTACYLDPPYFKAGPDLYRHGKFEHERLAGVLKKAKCHWLLSYDDHPAIRRLYSWAMIHDLEAGYERPDGSKALGRELVIVPREERRT